ncbi:nicotinate phosphoribosyltransferase [Brucepastera parasyntrophica]|uniref:nicotinate phosphoribosyltransferase n=1 Tax=Brucepastera parasyntrophica TaxID=2880008 RepID=UPI002109E2E0|nr:nicotinate phosphoribosyltransferase [Brucepastera parasyntrophica]ULQ61220.1 nicotinate phosphoribosyltransferase [Brucepastera parasyntrophica]
MMDSALFSDFYELTMAQGFWKQQKNSPSVFDMFFRRQPFNGGFSVFAGLEPLIDIIEQFSFSEDDLAYLDSTGMFEKGFLDYLKNFRFSGELYAMNEGTVIFPNEPLIRVHAPVIECAIIEGLVLNTVNFQSLIATKTARIWLASNKGSIMEFGLRRAQGYNGAMSASRAAFIGGVAGTSNTLAGKKYNIPVMGTMAHSWVMSFPTEEEAFDAYASMYPGKSVFLIDTYNTLESGIHAAIASGRKLAEKGYNFGIRLDSGDIQYLSTKVREKLDKAGLPDAAITVSNELTEEIIQSLIFNKAPIDSWGVGTHLVTGGSESSFTGVYKLSAHTGTDGKLAPAMKLSDNPEKTTNPGVKQVWRLFNDDGTIKADVLALDEETITAGETNRYYHPSNDYQTFSFSAAKAEPLLSKKMSGGKRFAREQSLDEIRTALRSGLDQLDYSYKRFLNPHLYKVSLTARLRDMKFGFLKQYGQ